MKNLIKIFSLLVLLIGLISCEEEFSPKNEFQEKYVLSCIIRADTTQQIAVVTRSYDVPGYNPYSNTTDPALDGAYIRIWYQDTVYTLTDTLVDRIDTTRYDTPVKIYKIDNFQPALDSELEIEALLNNGRRLRAFTSLPQTFKFNYNSDSSIPGNEEDAVTIGWYTASNKMMYLPQLKVYWYRKSIGKQDIRQLEIPLDYVNSGGSEVEYYPPASKTLGITYKMDVIDKALRGISEGNENKEDYYIIFARLEVIAMDENLASYYASTSVGGDNFSVRLDEADFSNVQGGYGIFGSYIKKSTSISLDSDYIRSLGYKPEL
ncbi:MAG: hypothetical protein SCALA702_08690 [Melioribacteraceae bacterium]|nr:MAG: hypothetical protein SCALA702_08690 [Melioribacteraceae bacterium]